MDRFKKVSGVLVAAGAFLGISSSVGAATIYYDTNGSTPGTGTGASDWNSSSTNWNFDPDGGTAVANPTTGTTGTQAWASSGTGDLDGSDVVFSASDPSALPPAAYSINCGGSKAPNSITVNASAITLKVLGGSAATRTIGAGGITLNQPDPGGTTAPLTFASPTGAGAFNIVIAANQTWANNSGATNAITLTPFANAGLMTVNSNATAGNTYTLTLGGSAAGAYNIGVAFGDGSAGGKLALSTSKNTNITNVVSTYSGGTTITAGATLLDNGGGLAHSNISISGGSLAGGTTGTGGSLTDNIVGDTGELISLSGGGVLNLTNLNFDLLASGTQTLSEYVLANADVGSANVVGTGFATTNLPSGWSIDYSGTTAHPGDIVLVDGNVSVPEPATLGLLAGLGGLALARRRRI